MATPLSDQIRALIAYANETTEASDTKLGDCVKALCDGYNGGGSAPSSPLVIPQGALSSRLAALLAYANETTGKGDTLLGDAIRNLCDGYGAGEEQGELVFYEKLIGSGGAYIKTGINAASNAGMWLKFAPNTATDYSAIGGRQGSTTATRFFIGKESYIYAGYGSLYNLGTNKKDGTVYEVSLNMYNNRKSECPTNNISLDITESSSGCSREIWLVRTNRAGSPGGAFEGGIYGAKITLGETLVRNLVPCTYNGEAGMWDLVSQTFFGNAASSGQLTVEGEIGKAIFFDTLKLPALAYSVDCSINMGKVLAEPYTDLYYLFKNNSGVNAGDFLGGNAANNRKVFISNYVVRFAFGSSTANYVNSALNNANQKDAMLHVHGTTIDMTILDTSATTTYSTVQCANLDGDLFLNKNFNTNKQASRIFHSLRVENNGKVLHDIVPAMSKEGLIGVYDKITDKFFYSELGQEYYILENTL